MKQKLALFSRAAILWLIVLLPLIGVFMGRVSEVILSLIALFIALEAFAKERLRAEIQRLLGGLKTPLGLAILAFFLWVFVSCFWAYFPKMALLHTTQALGLFAASYLLFDYVRHYPWPEMKGKLLFSLIAACVIYGILLLILKNSQSFLNIIYSNLAIFNRPATGFWLLALPLLMGLNKPFHVALLLGAMVILTFSTISTSSSLAAAMALAVYILSLWKPRVILHSVMGLCLSFIVFAPLITHWPLKYGHLLPSFVKLGSSSTHRMAIWDNFATLSHVKTLFGWGADSSRMMLDNPAFKAIPLNNPELNVGMHPHMFSLQVWVELGGVGAMLAALVWLCLWARLNLLPAKQMRFAAMFVAAAFAVSCVNYSLWQGWWMAYIGFGIALFIAPQEDNMKA